MDRAYWDSIARSYDDKILDALRSDRKRVIRRTIEEHADKGMVAADFGCGVGKTLPLLSKNFSFVDAFDLSSRNLELARRSCRSLPNVRYYHRDLSTGDATSLRVDFAVSINVLLTPSHEVRAGILRTMCRGLRPQGRLMLVVPSLESALYSDFRLLEWNMREGFSYEEACEEGLAADAKNCGAVANGMITLDGVPTKHYVREEMEVVLREAGFEPLETQKVEYTWRTEFDEVPSWLREPYPWDWMALARKK